MIFTDKKVLKCLFYYSIIVSLIILIIELIIHLGTFNYTIGFIIGAIISFICFMIMSFTVTKIIDNPYSKVKVLTFLSYLLRLIIYGLSLYLVYKSRLKYAVFTLFFGFLSPRICIFIVYNILDSFNYNKMGLEKLLLKEEIIKKMKVNKIEKVKDLSLKTREDLRVFLAENEIEEVIKALKKKELYLKGELEVIKEDDSSFNK